MENVLYMALYRTFLHKSSMYHQKGFFYCYDYDLITIEEPFFGVIQNTYSTSSLNLKNFYNAKNPLIMQRVV